MAHVLEEVAVKDLVGGEKRLAYVELDDSLEWALKLLADDNVLAMPVRERDGAATREDGTEAPRELKFCGMLAVLDIAAFVAKEPDACSGTGADVTVAKAMRKTAESWHMLLLDPHATVARAMEYLGVRGFHRALVPNVCLSEHAPEAVPLPCALVEEVPPAARGEDYRVLSQMDVARFILRYEGRFGLALAQTIVSVGLEGGRVMATTRNEKLSAALSRMAGETVSALAVVDRLERSDGPWAAADALVLDTLSASDLRGCTVKDLRGAQSESVGEFLARRRGGQPARLLTCTKSSDVRSALKLMIESSVHRLWVVPEVYPATDDSAAPLLGVVSLSDVVRVMRVLPVTNSEEPEIGEGFSDAAGQMMWMDWM